MDERERQRARGNLLWLQALPFRKARKVVSEKKASV
jgi:hypothetical protein